METKFALLDIEGNKIIDGDLETMLNIDILITEIAGNFSKLVIENFKEINCDKE